MILAKHFVRRLTGCSRPLLLRCSDGGLYVVKFQGNPQHPRILVNDYLGSKIATHIGLPVPCVEIVEVEDDLIRNSPEMLFDLRDGQPVTVMPGRHFGSRYVISPINGSCYDYFPESAVTRVRDLTPFAGALAFDLWTHNQDQRQVVFWKSSREHLYRVSLIDQGYCFAGESWDFRHSAYLRIYHHHCVYSSVSGLSSFEPYLSAIESLDYGTIEGYAREIPSEWYGQWECLAEMIERLCQRRLVVRERLLQCVKIYPDAFPNWGRGPHEARLPRRPPVTVATSRVSAGRRLGIARLRASSTR